MTHYIFRMNTFWSEILVRENTVDLTSPVSNTMDLQSLNQHRSNVQNISPQTVVEWNLLPEHNLIQKPTLIPTAQPWCFHCGSSVFVFRCASFLLLHRPAKVLLLELLELLLCEQRLGLLGLLGRRLRAIPGLSPRVVAQDLRETESKSTTQ